MERLKSENISCIGFNEPDMDNQLTAIAAYGDNTEKIFSNLPLALKEYGRQKLTSKNTLSLSSVARAADSKSARRGFESHSDNIINNKK